MIHRVVPAILVWLASCGGRSTPSTSQEDTLATSYEDLRAGAVCDAGNWVPGSQEPAHYRACTRDSDCVKLAFPGCCTEYQVAIARRHACGSDLGSQCDMVCEKPRIVPEDAERKRVACVERACTLVR